MPLGRISPWETLLREAKRAAMPERAQLPLHAPRDYWVGLSLLTGGDIFLTPLEEILQIIPVPKMAKVPHVKAWLRGMAMSRGEIFATTDLSGFLNNRETHITKHARILMLSFGDNVCGILVDKVLGLHRMLRSEIQPCKQEKAQRPYQSYLIGLYVKKQIELPIISLKSIVEHPTFKNAVVLSSEMKE